ncbi:MAG: hypothetical protein AMJ79_15555 [Phycisphaerae bacterium SM23_30]|nr:MAG: hypothetical protein AMJ79_15555 [Phycisphaerae bacterium SM23_30]
MVTPNPPIQPVSPPLVTPDVTRGLGDLTRTAANRGGIVASVAQAQEFAEAQKYAVDRQVEIAQLEGRLRRDIADREAQTSRQIAQIQIGPYWLDADTRAKQAAAGIKVMDEEIGALREQRLRDAESYEMQKKAMRLVAENWKMTEVNNNFVNIAELQAAIKKEEMERQGFGLEGQQLDENGQPIVDTSPMTDPSGKLLAGVREEERMRKSYYDNIDAIKAQIDALLNYDPEHPGLFNNSKGSVVSGAIDKIMAKVPQNVEQLVKELPNMNPQQILMAFTVSGHVLNKLNEYLGPARTKEGKITESGLVQIIASNLNKYTVEEEPGKVDYAALVSRDIAGAPKTRGAKVEIEDVNSEAIALVKQYMGDLGKDIKGEELINLTKRLVREATWMKPAIDKRDDLLQAHVAMQMADVKNLSPDRDTQNRITMARHMAAGVYFPELLAKADEMYNGDIKKIGEVFKGMFLQSAIENGLPSAIELEKNDRLMQKKEIQQAYIDALKEHQENIRRMNTWWDEVDMDTIMWGMPLPQKPAPKAPEAVETPASGSFIPPSFSGKLQTEKNQYPFFGPGF